MSGSGTGDYEGVFLQVYECTVVEVELEGGGAQGGSRHLEE